MDNKEFLEATKKAYDEFDEFYEENEISPYGAAYRYFEAGAKFMKDQADESNDKYLRALAESENIKRNYTKKQNELYEFRYEPLMKEMLEIIDDYERGLANDAFSDGGKLIMGKMIKTLEKFGLERMGIEQGDDFDADTMEAASAMQFGEKYAGKVFDAVANGYKYNGKIIRFPKVVVGV